MPEERLRPCPASGDQLWILKSQSHWVAGLRTAGLMFGVLAVFGGLEQAASSTDKLRSVRVAQRAGPRIRVAPVIVAQPASHISLPIRIDSPEALPANTFLRLRGLPSSVSLTEGHSLGPGSWAVPLYALLTLRANIPAGVSGQSELVISLVGIDGTLLAEAETALVVASAAIPRPASPHQSGNPPPPVPAITPGRKSQATPRPVELSAEARERGEQLVAQGDRYLAQGKVAGARLFFKQAADAGVALGAMRLGATYDPVELSRLQVQGLAADGPEARRWYERARELGAPEADERLARLGGK